MDYTISKEFNYEWHGFGFPQPKQFKAHKVILNDEPTKNITVYHGEMGWILLAPEGKFYDGNGKRPVGFCNIATAVKHYTKQVQ